MTNRLSQFHRDASRARDLVGLGQSLGELTHGLVDGSDLFRAAVVQIVGALDAYVHGVVLDRAAAMLVGAQPLSNAAQMDRKLFGLHFGAVYSLLNAGSLAQLELDARTHIAQRLSLETFQRADAIATALAMVGISKIWSTAFGVRANEVKTELNLVVQRRNRIAHACDVDPLQPGAVNSLADTDALGAIIVVESIVTAVDTVC